MTASWKPGLHGVNVYRTPEAWAHPASTRASVTATALIAAAPWSSLASHTDFFIRSPHPRLGDARLAHALDPDVGVLAPVGCVGPPDHLPLAGLVGKAVARLPATDRVSAVASRVALVVWLLLPQPRDDIGREPALLPVAPLNQPRKIRFGPSGRQHAHHDLSSRFAKDLALTAQAVQRRRHVVKPLLHLRQEFRIVHVSPPLSDLYAFDIRRYGKSHTGTNLHTYQPFLQLRPTRLWQVSTRTGHLPAIAFPQSGPRERQAGGFSRQRYQTKTNVSG